jgi:hypothetical protein
LRIAGAQRPPRALLSCSKGSWANHPQRFAFRWKRNGAPITHATGRHYKVATVDVGKRLTCTVTATNGAGPSRPATSHSVSPIA